jgi:hypothetical protein
MDAIDCVYALIDSIARKLGILEEDADIACIDSLGDCKDCKMLWLNWGKWERE